MNIRQVLGQQGRATVRELVCTAVVTDQTALARRLKDPTGTAPIQRAFRAEGRQRWFSLRRLLSGAVVGQDLLGLKGLRPGVLQFGSPAGDFAALDMAGKIAAFSDWLHATQVRLLLEGGGIWMRPFIARAYQRGVHDALSLLPTPPPVLPDRAEVFYQLATVELHGVIDAIDQQVTRAVSVALTERRSPRQLFAAISDRLRKVGMRRFDAMVADISVRAHAEASLDVYEAAGRKSVSLVPEVHLRFRGRDALVHDAPRLKRRKGETQEDYEERRDRTQGRRAVRRAAAAGGVIARAIKRSARKRRGESLEILTAGDADVCAVCERLARNQYTLREARGLLPAHNECRCIWVTSDAGEEFE